MCQEISIKYKCFEAYPLTAIKCAVITPIVAYLSNVIPSFFSLDLNFANAASCFDCKCRLKPVPHLRTFSQNTVFGNLLPHLKTILFKSLTNLTALSKISLPTRMEKKCLEHFCPGV